MAMAAAIMSTNIGNSFSREMLNRSVTGRMTVPLVMQFESSSRNGRAENPAVAVSALRRLLKRPRAQAAYALEPPALVMTATSPPSRGEKTIMAIFSPSFADHDVYRGGEALNQA